LQVSNNKLPSVTSDIPRDLRTFIDRLREIITGSGSGKIVTVGDLVSGGIASVTPGGGITTPDLSIDAPIVPTNVQADGAIQNILVSWDDPLYKGHAYAEVWGADTDDVGVAVLLGTSAGTTYTDFAGPSKVRYYWVRFVNRADVIGAFNAVSGTRGETGPEVQHLLDVLTGQITETQLYTDLGSRIDLIDGSGAGSVNARIAVETQNRTTADSAIAASVTTLSTTVDGHTTSIQTVTQTTDGLKAKYTVKIDNNGYVSGFGLASEANNGATVSDFAIRADKFYIASPTGPGITPSMPFIVQTTEQTINGEVVPVGVYITDAFIRNGTITNAKIANATIDSAKIISLTADKLTAGSIDVGEYIKSSNFITGSQGWVINGDGTAEFGAAAIRDKLTASQIDARGLSILDTNGNPILTAGSSVATSNYGGNIYGTINGTAAATVVDNAATAKADSATALTNANAALTSANSKLSKTAADTLVGPITLNAANAITVGTPALDSVAGHNGLYLGSTGIVGTRDGKATFTVDNSGNAYFGGEIGVGNNPTISDTTMTGSGATIKPDGKFSLGNATTNITFNGTVMKLNGNVVTKDNMAVGATAPNYVRVYTGSTRITAGYTPGGQQPTLLPFDNYSLINYIGASDYDAYRTLLKAGKYYFELTVPLNCPGSDTNTGTFLYIVSNPPGATAPWAVLKSAAATPLGDWQLMPVQGVGVFTLSTDTYISITLETNDSPVPLTWPLATGAASTILKIWSLS
jgi:hypothetical protein